MRKIKLKIETFRLIFVKRFKNSLIQDAGSYTIFNLIDRAIPFLLLPIITRYLNPDEYGYYVTFQALVGFIIPFATLNTDAAILRAFYSKKGTEFSKYFSSGFNISLIIAVFFVLIFSFLSKPLAILLNFSKEWLVPVVIVCFLQYVTELNLNIFQVRRQAKKYGIYRISLTSVKNTLMIIFVIVLKYSWNGLIISQIISLSIFACISIYFFLNQYLLTTKINKIDAYDNIKYGAPLTLHRIGGWLTELSGRIILNIMIGTMATGLFSVGASIGMIITLLQDSFNKAYIPYLFDKLNRVTDEIKVKLVSLTYLYHIIILSVSIIIGVVGYYFVGAIFGERYANSREFIIWIIIGYAFNGMYKMHVNYLFYEKRTDVIFYVTFFSGILNIISCYILIKFDGAIGAAQSLLVGYFLSFVFTWYLAQKFYPLPWIKVIKNISLIKNLIFGS